MHVFPETCDWVQDGDITWSYAQMASRVYLLRGALKRLGIQAGERVGIMLPNSAAHLVGLTKLAMAWLSNVKHSKHMFKKISKLSIF